MASQLYSLELLSVVLTNTTYTLTLPAGSFIYVVRDIDAYCIPGEPTTANLSIYDLPGVPFAGTFNTNSTTGTFYSWRGRQVFSAGDEIFVAALGEWGVRISGYKLTAP
jgi:hypothetical protein